MHTLQVTLLETWICLAEWAGCMTLQWPAVTYSTSYSSIVDTVSWNRMTSAPSLYHEQLCPNPCTAHWLYYIVALVPLCVDLRNSGCQHAQIDGSETVWKCPQQTGVKSEAVGQAEKKCHLWEAAIFLSGLKWRGYILCWYSIHSLKGMKYMHRVIEDHFTTVI